MFQYFQRRGIACSRTSVYNAPGNGQCERYNGIIWTAVKLALKSRKLDTRQWELVLPDALHSIRSLLCTATNQTPHKRLFNFRRKSSFGTSVPSWLSNQGPVYLKRHVRPSKNDPIVDEVELVHSTPNYAVVRMPSGRETTVSLRDVAPCNVGGDEEKPTSTTNTRNDVDRNPQSPVANNFDNNADCEELNINPEMSDSVNIPEAPRRSSRARKGVDRYGAVPYV